MRLTLVVALVLHDGSNLGRRCISSPAQFWSAPCSHHVFAQHLLIRRLMRSHPACSLHRCLVEAIEDIARALKLPELMLCSTNDDSVKSTWYHLGFDFASEEEMERWDVPHSDLVYLQNTTQVCGSQQQSVCSDIGRHQEKRKCTPTMSALKH